MKFEDIRYDDRNEMYGQTPGLTMPGGFFVFATTIRQAWKAVHDNWTKIDWTQRQCAETMIGDDVWQTKGDGAKRALGRCIAFFVKHDMLPQRLVLAKTLKGKKYKGGKRLYVLAQPVIANPLPVTKVSASRLARNKSLLARVDWAALQGAIPTELLGEQA